jgi:Kef-type K+ transport system membrane component KefB
MVTACHGKGVACWLGARLNGESPRNSLAIGALMNSRGLMEIVLLNLGIDYGIITPTLFTIMVVMTVITTLMAAPILDAVGIPRISSTTSWVAVDRVGMHPGSEIPRQPLHP